MEDEVDKEMVAHSGQHQSSLGAIQMWERRPYRRGKMTVLLTLRMAVLRDVWQAEITQINDDESRVAFSLLSGESAVKMLCGVREHVMSLETRVVDV